MTSSLNDIDLVLPDPKLSHVKHLFVHGYAVLYNAMTRDDRHDILNSIMSYENSEGIRYDKYGRAMNIGAQSSAMWHSRIIASDIFNKIWFNSDEIINGLFTSLESFRNGSKV